MGCACGMSGKENLCVCVCVCVCIHIPRVLVGKPHRKQTTWWIWAWMGG